MTTQDIVIQKAWQGQGEEKREDDEEFVCVYY